MDVPPARPSDPHHIPLPGDQAQKLLIKHLATTEALFAEALRDVDQTAECQIRGAADLGVPYDALRLAGGFATGCLVDWVSRVPVVPVDTTMNVDTSSVFWLDGDPTGVMTDAHLEHARQRIGEESTYYWNFDSGNHFISVCRNPTGRWALVLHSDAKEFKTQLNGLYPADDNWYASDVKVFGSSRPIRLLIGDKAETFADLSLMLRSFNRLRHRIVAQVLLADAVQIVDEWHKEHYFMPTDSTACLGAYLCEPDERVLIFSQVGIPLVFFSPSVGGGNEVNLLTGKSYLLVPHGWGIGADCESIHVRWPYIYLDDRSYAVSLGTTLFTDPLVRPRQFASPGDFLNRIRLHTPGHIVEWLEQIASYSRHGLRYHHGSDKVELRR